MRKLLCAAGLLIAMPLMAFAGPLGLPDHQPDGYRDTGCDPAFQKQITNDAGDYLYSNNPTCPAVTENGGFAAFLASIPKPPKEDNEEEDVGNGDETSDFIIPSPSW